MEYVRIAVLSADETVCTFFDDQIPAAMHYSEACLHTYLQGSAYTLEIETDTQHEDTQYLVEGNKVSFVFKDRDYMCNIVSVERTETDITVTCWGLLLELTNEIREAYKSNGAMSLQQYINYIDPEHVLTLGINEVAEKRISNEWEGSQTILARLYSIANLFDAEMEFLTILNDDYSLKQVTLNVYRAHDDKHQGMGINRTDQILRFGDTVETIRKTSDITDLFTAIHVVGTNDSEVAGFGDKKEYDSEGRLEYYSQNNTIFAPLARDRFPSNVNKSNDRYILKEWTYDSDDKNVLYGQGLAQLKKYCMPQVMYEIQGYYDANIGDTFTIVDDAYKPTLILEARVTEQEEFFVDPTQNTTTYSNVIELESEVAPGLLEAMQKLISRNKVFTCSISTDNGVQFKNLEGSTTLTAQIRDGKIDASSSFSIRWYKNGAQVGANRSIKVTALDVIAKAVYRFVAYNGEGDSIGDAEVTLTNVNDGETGKDGKDGQDGQNGRDGTPGADGAPGKPGADGRTSYTHIAYANSADGKTDFSTTDSNRKYVGMYVDFTQADSNDPSLYHWSLIKGADGSNGTPGKPGEDGKTPYFHVAYANSSDGKTGFSVSDSNNKTYIGQYTDYTQADSVDPSKYMWTKIKGDTGTPGADGKTSYLHIAYADSADGKTRFSLTEVGDRQYIGQYTDYSNTASTDPTKYTWGRFRGQDGKDGADGKDGKDGANGDNVIAGDLTLSPIVLSADSTGNVSDYSKAKGNFEVHDGLTVVSSGVKYSVVSNSNIAVAINANTGAYSVTSMPVSADYGTSMLQAVYNGITLQRTLAVIKAKSGASGKGVKSTQVRYQIGDSGTAAPTGTWQEGIPSVPANKYLWTRTVTTYTDDTGYTAYSVSKMGGDGKDGSPGKNGVDGKAGTNGKDGANGKDGVGISSTQVRYQTGSSGTSAPTGTWLDTIPAVGAGQYLWTRTITNYTNGTSTTAYSVGKMGANGTNGVDGDSGIIIQATAPSNPYVGQLWQTASGAPIKRWDGSKWVIWYLDVSNLNVQNLAAITANIGEIHNDYVYPDAQGRLSIGMGDIINEISALDGGVKGKWQLGQQGFTNVRYADDSGNFLSGVGVTNYEIAFFNRAYSVSDWFYFNAYDIIKMQNIVRTSFVFPFQDNDYSAVLMRNGNTVTLQGYWHFSVAGQTGGNTTHGRTIPIGYRPALNKVYARLTSKQNAKVIHLKIGTAGDVVIENAISVPAGEDFWLNVTWLTDDTFPVT